MAASLCASPKCLTIEGDSTIFERAPLEGLANDGELMAFRHNGFWQAMDTLRDRNYLENIWTNEDPKWKTWS